MCAFDFIVDLEVKYSFIEANIIYSTPIPLFEKDIHSFLIMIFSLIPHLLPILRCICTKLQAGTLHTQLFYKYLLLDPYILGLLRSICVPMLYFVLNNLIVIICVYRSDILPLILVLSRVIGNLYRLLVVGGEAERIR